MSRKTETGMDEIEEMLAHLIRQADDLSDIVAAQSRRIEALEQQVTFLIDRERGREQASGSLCLGNEPPPHY